MSLLIVSSSLHPSSKSRILARHCLEHLRTQNTSVDWLDLQDHDLPMCDGGTAYAHPELPDVHAKIEAAKGILICSPIYCYDVASPAKNLIALSGNVLRQEQKLIGLACAAGGPLSYMAPLPFMNSLMLDFRCLVLPNYVYASGKDFDNTEAPNEEIQQRLRILSDNLNDLATKLAS